MNIPRLLIFVFLIHSFSSFGRTNHSSPGLNGKAADWMNARPVLFVENKGQMMDMEGKPASFILFKAQAPGVDLYITEKGLTYVFKKLEENELTRASSVRNEETIIKWARIDMELKGATILRSKVQVDNPSAWTNDYYYGHCPDGIKGVREYKRVTIEEVYPGIDWVFYNSDRGGFKYDFVVRPGSDPSLIKMLYRSEHKLELDSLGNLELVTALGTLIEKAPYSYTEHSIVPSIFSKRELGNNETEVTVKGPSRSAELLTIDPALLWSTYYGGSMDDHAKSVDCDASGNIYVTGNTTSLNFPTKNIGTFFQGTKGGNTSFDAFIFKFSNAGVLCWATYYGDNSTDESYSISADIFGNIFVTGYTQSFNFPLQNAGTYFQNFNVGIDVFILKFDSLGNRLWATLYSGSGVEKGYGITTDIFGNVFVTGYTDNVFPSFNAGTYYQAFTGGGRSVFILKFDNLGNRLWATPYGGSGNEEGYAITTDVFGNVFITGYVSFHDMPTLDANTYFQTYAGSNNLTDAFILKFDNSGNRLWATFYGGTMDEAGYSIATDPFGNLFVGGLTVSQDFPVLNAGTFFQGSHSGGTTTDAFILKFDNSGKRLWASYYGGSSYEFFWSYDGLECDRCGNVYVSFCTQSPNLITLDPGNGEYHDGTYAGGTQWDVFQIRFGNTGVLQSASYWCGVNDDLFPPIDISPKSGALLTCTTTGLGLPLVNPLNGAYVDSTTNGGYDCHLAMLHSPICSYGYSALIANTKVLCNGMCNAMAAVSITNGTYPYTYSWSGGQTTQVVSGLCAGIYTVTVTDVWGMQASASVNIVQPALLTSNSASSGASCFGVCNGSSSVTASGGTAPYTYSWSGGGGSMFTATGLCAGTYTCVVTDGNGCVIASTVSITQPPALNINSSFSPTTCGNNNGSASLSSSGGTGPYTYSWSPGGSSGSAVTGLSSGFYSVTITDANSCTAALTVNIAASSYPQSAIQSQTNVQCNGSSTGSAAISTSNGTSPYTYTWSGGGTSSVITGLSAGSYTCTVTDAGGCTNTLAVTVTQPTSIVLGASSIGTTCNYSNGSASVTANGGTGSHSYSWSPSGGTNFSATGLSAGTYTVTVTDANGCTKTQSVSVAASSGPVASLQSQVNVLCNGASTGNASLSVSNGSAPYTYSWSGSGSTGASATGLGAGTYTCTVNDANGCTSTISVTITQPAQLTALGSTTNVSCNGNNNGTASVTVSGGTAGYTYSWSQGSVTGATASGLSAGAYTVTVIDANGCSLVQTFFLTQPAPLLTTTSSLPACGANSGIAVSTVSGGTGPYTYSWAPAGGAGASATGLSSGNYTCTVTDANGCTLLSTVSVVSNPLPVVTASGGGVVDYGQSAVLSAAGGASYSWSPSEGLSCTDCQNPTALPSVTTVYCVTVTDSNGCTNTACVTLEVNCGDIFVPNVFSPNGDNRNDLECVYGKCVEYVRFIIYDRWGERMFESSDMNRCWDGTYKGQQLNTAVFVYYLEAYLVTGELITRKGNITLLR